MDKKNAAEYLGVSTRAVERYVSKGKLTPTYEKGRTGPAPIFDPVQLDALKTEMNSQLDSLTGDKADKVKPGKADKSVLVVRKNLDLSPLISVLEAVSSPVRPVASLGVKLALTLAEASALTGVSQNRLRDALKSGELKGKRGLSRGWLILRTDLEAWLASWK